MNRKHSFFLCCLLLSHVFAASQTPGLQQVTDVGSVTTNSISISNGQGISLGVDPASGYTVKNHFIRPFNAQHRTLRFDCSSSDDNGGWEFYNSSINSSLMYVKQSGNVGIGIVNPQSRL